jgi:nucleotide-binding universal stress UspA family protein
MAPTIVVSYDGTPDDDDAIALGKVFAQYGCPIALAYVRHSRLEDAAAEERENRAAAKLLERGASQFESEVKTYVLFNPSTAEALRELIGREGFDVITFGSSYRTPAGHVAPGRAAQQLIDGGPAAVALAPAGLRDKEPELKKVAVVSAGPGDAADQTARSFGAEVGPAPDPTADLLVIASRAGVPKGQASIPAASEQLAEEAAFCPVLVVANDTPLDFSS